MPVRKKLLFVVAHMQVNGAMRSLLNLLSALDRAKYDIHLLIYAWGDALMPQVPADIKLVPENMILRIFDLPFSAAVQTAWRQRMWRALVLRLLAGVQSKVLKAARAKESAWRLIDPIDDGYDVAIGFCEGSTHRFVAEKVVARRKVGWVHVDYRSHPCDEALERKAYAALDRVVTVSSAARDSIIRKIGAEKEKVAVIPNLSGARFIRACAQSPELRGEQAAGGLRILSIGRLTPEKGFDIALEACKLLVGRLPAFTWFLIGEGHARAALEAEIRKHKLQEHIVLLGQLANPYPWLATCDIYVQPSRTESWGMTITEAKLFGKAIVASDIPAFREQIVSGETGLLVQLSPQAVADAVVRLASDRDMRAHLEARLAGFDGGDCEKLAAFDDVIATL